MLNAMSIILTSHNENVQTAFRYHRAFPQFNAVNTGNCRIDMFGVRREHGCCLRVGEVVGASGKADYGFSRNTRMPSRSLRQKANSSLPRASARG